MKLTRRETRKIIWSYVFLTPQLILYLALMIVPVIVSVPMAFTDRLNFTDQDYEYVGLKNFEQIFRDSSIRSTYLSALGRTLTFVVLNYATVFLFGLTLALLTYEIGFKGGIFDHLSALYAFRPGVGIYGCYVVL